MTGARLADKDADLLDLAMRRWIYLTASGEPGSPFGLGVTVLPAIAVGRGLEGTLRAHRIAAPRVTCQIICVHNPRADCYRRRRGYSFR